MESWVREKILFIVPADGSTIGNQSLIRKVMKAGEATGHGFTESAVHEAREQLLAEGVLKKGRGRGGSVYRTDGTASESAGRGDPDAGAVPPPSACGAMANGQYGSYRHGDQATLRPDVGVQDQFAASRRPKEYRYDSSLAPELAWDENAERGLAEWLLSLISEAAEQGEAEVFAQPRRWQGTGEAFESVRQCVARLKSLTQPFLNWAGKAERQQISVPTVPLFVHERHSTRAILEKLQSYKAAGQNLDLFGDPEVDIADKLDAYEHKGPWTNRMILGDSLQVMNSLLEYEGLGGQVQMIYMDPPYGVKFGSNFQPFVRKRDVKHGKDEEMIREPEMVKAYRDTWELGLHSYLSYLRDRLLLARELLTESGSVFVQISDENLHHVRETMDEVFGSENCVSIIAFKTTSSLGGSLLGKSCDYLIWYGKNLDMIHYKPLYIKRSLSDDIGGRYTRIELPDGTRRVMSTQERQDPTTIPQDAAIYRHDNLTSQSGTEKSQFSVNFEGEHFTPGRNYWKTNKIGIERLKSANRLAAPTQNSLTYVRYFNDFPFAAAYSGP